MSGKSDVEWYTGRFWEALSEGKFLVGDCSGCNVAHFPPAPNCPNCGADSDMTESARIGTIYSFTQQHRTPPGFDGPVVIGTIKLDEGPRVFMQIDASYEELRIGQMVYIAASKYQGNYDRGLASRYPMFIAVPQ